MIGIDPFIGDNENFLLPSGILEYLAKFGFVILGQIKSPLWEYQERGYWIQSKYFGMQGSWVVCWDNYINTLKNV